MATTKTLNQIANSVDLGDDPDGDIEYAEAVPVKAGNELAELFHTGTGATYTVKEIAQAIMGKASLSGGDPEEAADAIVARLLLSDTVEEALTATDIQGVDFILNTPVEVHAVKWMPSAYNDGPLVYAILDVTVFVTGERKAVTCGGSNVLAQLLRIQMAEAFPQVVEFYQAAKATKAGYYPLWMKAAKRPAATEPMPF